ncbi:hypothetical protein [Streptomyces sp. CA2R106]|uniref:hypothetical protein n=1 Tax=Streptomyces sp. CA2R106 TaxID=3120153 RepID=UPI003008401A
MPATTTADTITHILEHEHALRTNQAAYSADDVAALDPGLRWLAGHRWPACAAAAGAR